jgi:hypothetical protein
LNQELEAGDIEGRFSTGPWADSIVGRRFWCREVEAGQYCIELNFECIGVE